MYLNKIFSFVLFISLGKFQLYAQGNHTRHMRIKSMEYTQRELKSSKWQLTRHSISTFDKKGNLLHNMEFGVDSVFKSNELTIYNGNYDPIEVISYDQFGKQIKKTQIAYNFLHQKIEERILDENDNLLSSTSFEYDQFGHKILEIERDKANLEQAQIRYEYNKYGSLILKKIYRKGECVYEKKYTYHYF